MSENVIVVWLFPIYTTECFQKQMLGFDIVLRWKIQKYSNKE